MDDRPPCRADRVGGSGLTGEEKVRVLEAVVLLESATSNSLIAASRQQWNMERDRVLRELRGMMRA